jgi:hypothetical protein
VSYSLVLSQATNAESKDTGENTFLEALPDQYPVYIFYFPSELGNEQIESNLRSLGESTGANLYVNLGKLNDPSFEKIVRAFGIKSFPVVVVTATADLAGPPDSDVNSYVRLQGSLLKNPEDATAIIEKVYLLFLQGDIERALRQVTAKQIQHVAQIVGRVLVRALKSIGNYIANHDISVSFVVGKFEVKKSSAT